LPLAASALATGQTEATASAASNPRLALTDLLAPTLIRRYITTFPGD
jgi:hypothetical protein